MSRTLSPHHMLPMSNAQYYSEATSWPLQFKFRQPEDVAEGGEK